jgi:hypothetical protein
MASPSFVPFAHPHVSYTSHSHSEDVDDFTGAYSEASDHSEAGNVNLDVRMTAIETEVKDIKAELKDLKDFNKEIIHKIDILGITFEKELDLYAYDHKQQLSSYALDYKEQLSSYLNS